MTVSLSANALTTLAAFKSAWGVSVDSCDEQIKRAINIASDRIAKYCGRAFGYQAVSDEMHAGMGTKLLTLDRPPIIGDISSVKHDDVELASSEYEIHDADAGMLAHVNGGWRWDADLLAGCVSCSPMPGSERNRYAVSYAGGWVLPGQAAAGAVLGTESEDFVFGSDLSLVYATDVGTTTIVIEAGTYTAAQIETIADSAIYAGGLKDSQCSAIGANVKFCHTGTDEDNTIQMQASDAATLLGLDTDEHAGTRTLPWDLEQAGIEAAAAVWLGFGTAKNVESEKLLSYSVKYNLGSQVGGLPQVVTEMLTPYRRLL